MDPSDKRKHPRFEARFDTLCSFGRAAGTGVLTDVSYSGARLEDVSHVPELGTKIRLYVFVLPVSPFELEGEVVRRSESGFAIEYSVESPDVRRLVDDVTAVLAAL